MNTTISKRLIIKLVLRNLDIINPYEREIFIAVVRVKNNPYAENLLQLVDIIIQPRRIGVLPPEDLLTLYNTATIAHPTKPYLSKDIAISGLSNRYMHPLVEI